MSKLTKPYFTKKQLMCIELLANGQATQAAIASQIGVNPMSITRWKKDPKFMHAVTMRSRAMLKEELPAVYKSLALNSKEGSHQHIKILLDHMESLEQARAGQASITFVWKDEDKPNEDAE